MEKIMPLDLLASIRGAESSEAVEELFRVIREAMKEQEGTDIIETDIRQSASLERLRSDIPEACPEPVKELIRKNFPQEKNGYLLVPKVIED